MLKVENISKIYDGKGVAFKALDEVNLTVSSNEIVAIVGKSGSGKTTLLNSMSTITDISEGDIFYNEVCLNKLSEKEKAEIRLNNFGFVFQRYELFQTLNVYDNIILPMHLNRKKADKEYLNDILNLLDIASEVDKMPHELSGGQQQRVTIARALIAKPKVIFADEPTGNLDSTNSELVMKLFLDAVRKYNSTLIYVTHDNNMAKEADRIITVKDGKVFE